MKKERKSATILKPIFDEEAVLQFASAGPGQVQPSTDRLPKAAPKPPATKKSSHAGLEMDTRQISLTISKDLYDRIAKEAAHKNRTVEEHLKKHLNKRYEK